MGSNQQLETLDYGFLYFVESKYYEDVDTPSHHPLPIGPEDSKSWPKKKNMTTLQKKTLQSSKFWTSKKGCWFFFTREFWWFRIFHPVVSSDVSSYHFGPTFSKISSGFRCLAPKNGANNSGPRKKHPATPVQETEEKKQKNFKGFDRIRWNQKFIFGAWDVTISWKCFASLGYFLNWKTMPFLPFRRFAMFAMHLFFAGLKLSTIVSYLVVWLGFDSCDALKKRGLLLQGTPIRISPGPKPPIYY